MSYRLTLTPVDMSTIYFVGDRYSWSAALSKVHSRCENLDQNDDDWESGGTYIIPEHVAWELYEAFNEDTEGGHSLFPMLDPRSDLYTKLVDFMGEIV